MTFRLFVFSAVALCLVPSAAAQACTKGRFQGAAPYVAKDVHADILAGKTGFESQRAKLEGFRKNERTCIGKDTIEFAIALIDVNEAPLQQSVEALPVVMRASVPEGEKAYMMNRLIERFYAGRSTMSDKARILAGRTPVPLSGALSALTGQAAPLLDPARKGPR